MSYLAAACTLVFLGWALQPAAKYLMRSQKAILVDQLRGEGCQYQEPYLEAHTLNPLAGFFVRHPDFYCPMWAAGHLAKAGGLLEAEAERLAVLNAFDQALRRMPESFDTGDGVIKYGSYLRLAREAYLKKK